METLHHHPEEERLRNTAVFFDIDNTIIDGFSIFHFADFLITQGLFHQNIKIIIEEELEKFRNGQIDYRDFAIKVVDSYSFGLQGFSEERVIDAGNKFVDTYEEKLFPYSRELINLMNQIGQIIAISGAPKEAFKPLGYRLGIKRVYLLEAQVSKGVYTGKTKVNMALDEEKSKVIRRLVKRSFNPLFSFAFGDSIHDLPLLKAVSNPCVVGNRDFELLEIAQRNNWMIANTDNIIEAVSQRLTELQQ